MCLTRNVLIETARHATAIRRHVEQTFMCLMPTKTKRNEMKEVKYILLLFLSDVFLNSLYIKGKTQRMKATDHVTPV